MENDSRRLEFLKNLRRLEAAFVGNPDLPLPLYTTITVPCESVEQLGLAARALGKVEKVFDEYSAGVDFALTSDVKVSFYLPRASVCKQVGTEKRLVKVKVPLTFEEREEEQEVAVWDCPPAFLAEPER